MLCPAAHAFQNQVPLRCVARLQHENAIDLLSDDRCASVLRADTVLKAEVGDVIGTESVVK